MTPRQHDNFRISVSSTSHTYSHCKKKKLAWPSAWKVIIAVWPPVRNELLLLLLSIVSNNRENDRGIALAKRTYVLIAVKGLQRRPTQRIEGTFWRKTGLGLRTRSKKCRKLAVLKAKVGVRFKQMGKFTLTFIVFSYVIGLSLA